MFTLGDQLCSRGDGGRDGQRRSEEDLRVGRRRDGGGTRRVVLFFEWCNRFSLIIEGEEKGERLGLRRERGMKVTRERGESSGRVGAESDDDLGLGDEELEVGQDEAVSLPDLNLGPLHVDDLDEPDRLI